MQKDFILRIAGWLIIPAILMFMPAPEGLSHKAWILSAYYIAAIMGLIFRPLPEPAVLLMVLGSYSVFSGGTSVALSGYSAPGCWLVIGAFLVGRAFIDTGVGPRIAYTLIDKFGKSSLALGYVATFTDLIIAPATPSNTARTGGIVFPIFRSVASTLGSEPGPSSRRIGAYIAQLLHYVSLMTGAMFLTSNATNLLVVGFAKTIFGIEVSWASFALSVAVPGFVVLMLGPWLVYKIFPPEITKIDNKHIAKEGLDKLGPMSIREKMLIALFILALVLWSTTAWTKVNSTAVAVFFVGALLFLRIVTWDTLVSEKGAWTTLIWYGGILGLAGGLAQEGYFKWMATVLNQYVSFEGMHPVTVVLLLVICTFPLRYLFASLGSYVVTMIPVILTLAKIGGVPGELALYAICPTTLYFCLLTHFANAASPALFGPGYVTQRAWWTNGLILSIIATSVLYLIGFPWWKMLGYW